jgi:mono/diheme cytochrome c family protein
VKTVLAAAVLAASLVACTQGGSGPELAPDLESGRETFIARCAACHGGNGQGASAPALHAVASTFTRCEAQIEWIMLGSERYRTEIGPVYGDVGKEISGGMPEFESSLSETEIAQVAAFQRHQFGGVSAESALDDCGL